MPAVDLAAALEAALEEREPVGKGKTCPKCGAPYRKVVSQSGRFTLYHLRDDCCAERAGDQLLEFAPRAYDHAHTEPDRKEFADLCRRLVRKVAEQYPSFAERYVDALKRAQYQPRDVERRLNALLVDFGLARQETPQ